MDIHSDCAILDSIPGKPPDLLNPPKGCRFWPRCTIGKADCETEEQALIEIAPNHYVACDNTNESK